MARATSEEEFDRFFHDVKKGLAGQAYLLTSDIEESKDLAQEVLLRAWRDWDRISQLAHPEAWARRVLHNLAVGRWRRRRTERRHVTTTSGPAADSLDIDALLLADALRRLPIRHRQVLVLKAVVGLRTSEIADELGASDGTVRMWLSRGRAELLSALAEQAPSSGEENR